MEAFSSAIVAFGTQLVQMQIRRHDADYNPHAAFLKSEVLSELSTTRQAIEDFCREPVKDRRAFAAYVLLKDRRE